MIYIDWDNPQLEYPPSTMAQMRKAFKNLRRRERYAEKKNEQKKKQKAI
jgi:hypothetical protein